MSSLEQYAHDFFDMLKMSSDAEEHNFKYFLAEAVYDFLSDQTKEKAYVVYSMFFDIYRIKETSGRSFVDLLDMLKEYEENASVLSDGQRDHYVHSVNVFILGLCIYSRNNMVRQAMESDFRRPGYKARFQEMAEEFLFIWGLAALFHDIGYPIEIINNQVNQFIRYVATEDCKQIGPYISYKDFGRLDGFGAERSGEDSGYVNKPTRLLADCISMRLGLPTDDVRHTLNSFLDRMQKNDFVDHGFYSAIIVLRWYGELLADDPDTTEVFNNQIVGASTAIFLHNAYRNVFQKKPYNCGPLEIERFPTAYLLILCDEAQEWNRQAYGTKARTQLAVDDSYVDISDRSIVFRYVTSKGLLNEQYVLGKEQLFSKLLDIGRVFDNGLTVHATTTSDGLIGMLKKSTVLPRLLAENIEQLARQIHLDYCRTQMERQPGKALEYPSWEQLPDSLKYSNVRQAQTIVDKLRIIGCYVGRAGEHPEYNLSEEELELLAKYEHELWVEERIKNGWSYGEVKDAERKTSPYLVPYEELSEGIKELDRDTIRNIPKLMQFVGLSVYRL